MKRQKRLLISFILLMAAAMLALVLLILSRMPEKPLMERVTFRDEITGLELRPVFDEMSGRYVLFLPAHAEPKDIHMSFPGAWLRVRLAESGEEESAKNLAQMPLSEPLMLTARSLFKWEGEPLELQRCEGLPTLFLQAESGALEYLHEDKNNRKDALALLTGEDGSLIFSQVCTVSGRGNSSWEGQAKRPYELSFEGGVSFGPFEDIERFCLLAEYSDESKLHNAISYYGGQGMGLDYASPYQYVNVFFGGEYLGLYGIATKEEYKKHISSDGIQAVFEITSNLDKQDFQPELTRKPVRVLYGDADFVSSVVDGFEAALLYGGWEDCTRFIDGDSFARKCVMEELFANSDMTFASQYFYIDQENVIHCMLPWDYDLSLGYAFRYFNNKQVYEIEAYKERDDWYALLMGMEDFRSRMLHVLDTVCTPDFVRSLEEKLHETAETIAVSRECDLLRWRNDFAFNRFDLHCGEDSLEGMVRLYSDYFPQRVAYLKDHFQNWEDYCLVAFDGDQYGNLCIPRGANLWDYLEGANILQGEKVNWNFQGWYTADGRTPEDIGTVTEDILFIADYGQAES